MAEINEYKIRPYARLLTMLGEQLIKDERIALIEIIKNAYDADATWVKISFNNFGEKYEITDTSRIIIEDSGEGMSRKVIEDHWLNPATPIKKRKKKKSNLTRNGRVIQGEKGIGRFALFKLGKKVDIITKISEEDVEHVISYDFSMYDDEFLEEDGKEINLFLDDLSVSVIDREPELFNKREISLSTQKPSVLNHGTYIEVSDLIGSWSNKKIQSIYNDIARLEPIFYSLSDVSVPKDKEFKVWIYKDEENQKFNENFIEKLNFLLQNRSVIKIEDGCFDAEKSKFSYKENGNLKTLRLSDQSISGQQIYKNQFGGIDNLKERIHDCGSFKFGFYIFDFSSSAPPKYKLDRSDKDIAKEHRIYLYRDGIRVYPYGEKDDDWLRIDQYRGTVSAGMFLSNDQVVGYVNISQKGNPKLKDKTNREGLIEEGDTTEDFITLIQLFLAYIRQGPFSRYKIDTGKKKDLDIFKSKKVQEEFNKIKNLPDISKQTLSLIKSTEKLYLLERNYLERRADISEELAGVGLSVETASHDIMKMMETVEINLDGLLKDLMSESVLDRALLLKELQSIRGGMSFIETQLKDIQLIFTSSKQKKRNIRVIEIVEKVENIYQRLMTKRSINCTIQVVGSPLIAKTTDAVLLQLMLNLFDNSIYWLDQVVNKNKEILIRLDGKTGEMIFSDNGPGVKPEDAPYIFEPFYSGKGKEGRGLGLYIAKQLLERYDYSIYLAQLTSEKLLPGANFVVGFIGDDE